MKKLLTFALALGLVLSLCAPALATNPTEGDGSQELTGTTLVSHTVGSNYYITIPAAINPIETAAGTKILEGSGDFKVIAGSVLPVNKNLTFTITAATNHVATEGFKLVNSNDATVLIPYEIKDGDGNDVTLNNAFLTAIPAQANAGVTVALTVTTTAPYSSAGTYSDSLTITVKLVDP